MNQADKEESLRLLDNFEHRYRLSSEALLRLRELITRQKPDEDGERWRFCLEHGFPMRDPFDHPKLRAYWQMTVRRLHDEEVRLIEITPTLVVDAARAAMKVTS